MVFDIALQLYTLREELEKDFEGTLKQISKIGLKYVELAGYYGKNAEELKDILRSNNLRCISAHISFDDLASNTQEQADMLNALGAEYAVIPYISEDYHAGGSKYGKFLETIQKISDVFNKSGIKLLYHNHDFEFIKYKNKYKLDHLFESLPSEIMQFEPDTCWIRYAGVNPCEYLKKFEESCPIVHLKDFVADSAKQSVQGIDNGRCVDKQTDNFMFKPLGQGVMDIISIISAANTLGTKFFVIEQDQAPNIPAIECVKQSFEYLIKVLSEDVR